MIWYLVVAACGPKTVLVKHVFGVGWGGACQRSLYFVHYSVLHCKDLWDRCYVTCFYAAADGVGWGGVGWGGGGHVNVPCTSYINYSLLRCRDLWDRCCVTCCHAAEISGVVATWHALQRWRWKAKKRASNFSRFSKSSNQHGTVVKSPFLDTMCTPMSTVSGPAGCCSKHWTTPDPAREVREEEDEFAQDMRSKSVAGRFQPLKPWAKHHGFLEFAILTILNFRITHVVLLPLLNCCPLRSLAGWHVRACRPVVLLAWNSAAWVVGQWVTVLVRLPTVMVFLDNSPG